MAGLAYRLRWQFAWTKPSSLEALKVSNGIELQAACLPMVGNRSSVRHETESGRMQI